MKKTKFTIKSLSLFALTLALVFAIGCAPKARKAGGYLDTPPIALQRRE